MGKIGIKFKIFLTVLLVYLFYIAPEYLTANTTRYIILTKSIVEDKVFYIDKYHELTRDKGFYEGRCYIGAAPGLSFMAIPLYLIVRPLVVSLPAAVYQDLGFNILNIFCTLFLSILPGAAISVLLYGILQQFDLKKKERLLIVFTSAFGTILFYYSTRFTAHSAGAFLLFSGFYILLKDKSSPSKRYLLFFAGLCLGLAVLVEYTLIIGSVLCLIYSIFNFKKQTASKYLFLVSGLVLPAFIYMYYHYKCFENPFALGTAYSEMIGPVPLVVPSPKIIFELLFGFYRGIFTYMPILLLSIYGIIIFFRHPKKEHLSEMAFVILFFSFIFLTIAVFASKLWPWGGDFGPRFFVCVIPFLMIPIAFACRAIEYKMIFGIAAISIFINWCGVQYGDADSALTNIGLFLFGGLNSNIAEWSYKLVNTYIRKLNVITHFSPFAGFIVLVALIYLIWRSEIDDTMRAQFSGE